MTRILTTFARGCLWALLLFTPLAYGAVEGWTIATIHLVTLLAMTAILLQKAWTWDWKWIKTPLDMPILAVLVLTALSAALSVHPHTSLWSSVLFINYIALFYLTIHSITTRGQLRRLIYLVICIAAALSLYGLMTRFGNNPLPWYDYSFLKRSTDIVSSTYVNPNHFAGYLEMAIPLAVGLFLTGIRGGKLILVGYLTLVVVSGLVISLSRGGWLSAAVGLGFMAAALLTSRHFERKKLVFALAGVSFLAVLVVVTNRPVVQEVQTVTETSQEPSLMSRVAVWEKTIDVVAEYPALGTGPGTYSAVFTRYQPPGHSGRFTMAHNDYLHFVSETGVVLVPIMVWMIIAVYRKGLQKLKHPSRLVRGTTLGAMSGVTAILFHSIVDFNLHIPANAILFTVLAAITVSPVPKYDKPYWQLQEFERRTFLGRDEA